MQALDMEDGIARRELLPAVRCSPTASELCVVIEDNITPECSLIVISQCLAAHTTAIAVYMRLALSVVAGIRQAQ